MDYPNQTCLAGFILLGLSDVPHLQAILFTIFLMIYVITISGNILLIIVVRINSRLQTPMYFFLTNLSVIDICFSSSIAPKLLQNTLSTQGCISLFGCVVQMYVSLVMGSTECILLAVMAYDRYVAICSPLHYTSVMKHKLCICLAVGSWAVGLINAAIQVSLTFQLPFCGSHNLNHFFCEMPPFFQISCRDTWLNELMMYITAAIIAMFASFLTIISYIYIISTILKMPSSRGRYKVFSTCGSHITVISFYYGTIMFMYLRPRSRNSPETDKALSILYTMVIPMLNPIIYSVRNKDVKGVIKKKLVQKTLL